MTLPLQISLRTHVVEDCKLESASFFKHDYRLAMEYLADHLVLDDERVKVKEILDCLPEH